MEIIYRNNDYEIKQIIELGTIIGLFEILYKEDKISKEELDSLINATISDYDVDSLINYYNKKIKQEKEVKNGINKEESTKC